MERAPQPRRKLPERFHPASRAYCGWKKTPKKDEQTVFYAALDPTCNEPDEEYQDLSRPRMGTLQRQMVTDPGRNSLDQSGKAQDEGLTCWRTDLMPLSFTTQHVLTAFFKWWALKVDANRQTHVRRRQKMAPEI